MKFRKAIEIGENVVMNPPFLPKLQVGQHITVDRNPGRWVGLTPINTPWIVWPNTCGRRNVSWAIKTMHGALQELWRKHNARVQASAQHA